MPDRGLVPPPGLTLCVGTAPGVAACLTSLAGAFTARTPPVLLAVDAADEVGAAPEVTVPTPELTASW